MPYVERDEEGEVKGVFEQLQPGYAEEFVEDASEEMVAFRQRMLGAPSEET